LTRKVLGLSGSIATGDSGHFGTNDIDQINQLFTGTDQSSTDPITTNTQWTFTKAIIDAGLNTIKQSTAYDAYVYIDVNDSNKIKARMNRTGTIYSHATNADVVMQSVIDDLSSGSTVGSSSSPVPGAGDNLNLWTGGYYGAIFVGPGTYFVHTAIILKSNITIDGSGAWSTVFTFPNSLNLGTNAQDIFKSSQWDSKSIGGGTLTTAQLAQGDTGVRLRNFAIYGNARNQNLGGPGTATSNTATTTVVGGKEQAGTDSWGHGIAYYGYDLLIDNVLVHGCPGAGIIIQCPNAQLGSYVPAGSGQFNQISRILNVTSWGNGRQGLLLRCPFYVDRYWSYGNGEAGIDIQNCAYFGAAGWISNIEIFFDGQNHGGQATVTYDPLGFEMRLTGFVNFLSDCWIEGPYGPGDSLVMGIEVTSPTGYQLTGSCNNNNISNCYLDFPRKSGILMTPNAIYNNIQATITGPATQSFADFSESKAMTIQGGGRNNLNLEINSFNSGTVNGLVFGRLSPSAGSWNNTIFLNSIDNLYAIDWQNASNFYNSITCTCSTAGATAHYFLKPGGQTIDYTKNIIHVDGVGQSTVSTRGQNGGLATITTNGSTTAFTIPHLLYDVPNVVSVLPQTADARGDFFVTVDTTNITVTYPIAPPSGTNKLWWNARVSP
jgi:hypothetical protein